MNGADPLVGHSGTFTLIVSPRGLNEKRVKVLCLDPEIVDTVKKEFRMNTLQCTAGKTTSLLFVDRSCGGPAMGSLANKNGPSPLGKDIRFLCEV
jgi:hypothetical protein